MYMAPEILHNKDNGCGFTKFLFRLRLVHCTMVIGVILPCYSIFLKTSYVGEKLMKEGVDKMLWLLLIASHKTLACTCDIHN